MREWRDSFTHSELGFRYSQGVSFMLRTLYSQEKATDELGARWAKQQVWTKKSVLLPGSEPRLSGLPVITRIKK
jgi:hypothetical protein